MAFIAAAPVLKASTVSVVAFAPSSIIIYEQIHVEFKEGIPQLKLLLQGCRMIDTYREYLIVNTQLEISKLFNLLFVKPFSLQTLYCSYKQIR